MRWAATLLVLILTVVAATEPSTEYLPGDIWADGLLQYRVISQTDAGLIDDTANGSSTSLQGAVNELMSLTATSFVTCVVSNQYTLQITISKCLSPGQYEKVWNIMDWEVSNAKLNAVTYTYLECSSAVGFFGTPAAISAPPRIEFMLGTTTPTVPGAVAVRVCPALNCAVLSTDVVVASLTTSIFSVIPSSLRDSIDCPVPANSVSIREGNAGTCKCQCPGTSTTTGAICVCQAGHVLLNKVCTPCPTDSTVVNGACKCSGGRIMVVGECVCPIGTSLVNEVCQCSTPGQGFVGGCTTCPSGSTVVGGVCTCSGGRSIVNGACTCPAGTSFVNEVCQCSTPGQGFVGGMCTTCPSGSTVVGGVCTCSGGRSIVSGACTCPAGTSFVNGVCQCSTPGQGFIGGVCTTCPTGATVVDGVCTCSGGRSIVAGACACPLTFSFVDNVCKCSGGQSLSNNLCTCPAGTSFVNGVCQCSTPGQGFIGGVCTTCPTGATVVDGVCTCSGGRSIVAGACACPLTFSFVDNVCKCSGGQSLSNNLCTCPAGTSFVNGVCQCSTPGQGFIGGVCTTCPTGATVVDGVCTCSGGRSIVAGACACPLTFSFVDNVCKCSGGQSLSNNLCTCPAGTSFVNGVCQCSTPGQGFIGGVCTTCPTGATVVDGVCTCSGGRSIVAGACACPLTFSFVDNVCKCSGGQSLSNNLCTCPAGTSFVNGACQCSTPGQGFIGGVCTTCPTGATAVDGVCTCSGGRSIVGGACTCPDGQLLENGVCVPACFWNANNAGFMCSWSNPDKTAMKLEEDCKVIAPVAEDNYVADLRDNKNDATRDDPAITITATKHGGSLSVARKATWKDYFLTPTALENEITFSTFGVFDLLMTASDYNDAVTCSGCIAIVDTFPPTAVTKCTTTDAQITPVLYSDSLLAEAIDEEKEFTFFYSNDNVVNNGASETSVGASVRYDAVSAEIQDFFTTSVSNLNSVDDTCFDLDFVKYLLDKSPPGSPLTMYTQNELNALQCTRCCSKTVTLQEHYYDFKCGTEFAQTEKKLATSDKCAFKQCLKMTGDTLVKASASITTATADETTKVIAGLPSPIPAADAKTIHSSITCTTYAEGCSFTSALGDLFHRSSAWSAHAPDSHDVSDYVFWRYSIDTENWNSWSDAATLTFTTAESTVYVEAWTHCGQAYHDSFKVVLHPHSSHNACATFNKMWTEDSPSPQTDAEAHKCAYPGSDFVMMTFEYDSEADAIHAASTVKGKYTNVKCYVNLAEGGALGQVTETELPLTWPSSTDGRIQISKQIALELVHDPETAETTDVAVRCDFTFSYFNSGVTKVEPCPHTFTITDCDDPGLAAPGTEVCELGECESPTSIPGPFEACSGSVFTTVSGSSPLATQLKPLSGECCHDCRTTLACAAVSESTTTSGVKRCEPAPAGNQPDPMLAVALSVEDEDSPKSAASPSSNTLELLVASAMVAVVALVAVKQRMTDMTLAPNELDDVYVSLLD